MRVLILWFGCLRLRNHVQPFSGMQLPMLEDSTCTCRLHILVLCMTPLCAFLFNCIFICILNQLFLERASKQGSDFEWCQTSNSNSKLVKHLQNSNVNTSLLQNDLCTLVWTDFVHYLRNKDNDEDLVFKLRRHANLKYYWIVSWCCTNCKEWFTLLKGWSLPFRILTAN